jgi:ABC-type transport system involved in multi-copper enzyme maturation permease subunit
MEMGFSNAPSTRLWDLLFKTQWFGPIFAKELKIMARQRRFYMLRAVYLMILVALMGLVWVEVMPEMDARRGQMAARMARAGKTIVVFIAWFQFIGLQLVTVVTMSNAINEEITRRTLPTLMTTPITSAQIVLGKLTSKGVQLLLLFCISMPLLAMVRVFGGVPWGYLLSTFCMTVTAVWFLSCLTLLFSILFKRAYTTLIFTVITTALLFGLIPMLMLYFRPGRPFRGSTRGVGNLLAYVCPYVGFWRETDFMMSARTRGPTFFWPAHCVFMALLSLPLLRLACMRVRRAALRHMSPRKNRPEHPVPRPRAKKDVLHRPLFLHNWIARTWGTGLVWKEFLVPVLGRFRFAVYVGTLAFTGLFLLAVFSALVLYRLELLSVVFILGITFFFILAVIFTAVVPAACITSEKESRTWTLLLTTPLSHGQILRGKLVGVLRRIVLAWSPFLIITGLLTYTLKMPLSATLQIAVVAVVSIGFLVALGIYVSSRFDRTTPAVVTNLSLVGVLWGLLPFVALFLQEMQYHWRWIRQSAACRIFTEGTLHMTPPGLAMTLLRYTSQGNELWYYRSDVGQNYGLAFLILYGGATALLLWRAQANLRRHAV